MIAKLTGIVDSIGEDWAVIDVAGVGYLVFCNGRTLGRLSIGESAVLLVETEMREDRIQLYGFAETAEREWFRLLTTVQGVGAKAALAILTVLAPGDLVRAIAAADRAAIRRAAGVGPKLAGRIVSELKDKVANITLGPAAATDAPASVATADAVSALVNLGYTPSEALAAVSDSARRLGADAATAALIRAALSELAPAEPGR